MVLHPKSVYQVPGVWHGVAQLHGFHPGVDLLHGEEAREEVLDRVRFFAEDCDSLQVGFGCCIFKPPCSAVSAASNSIVCKDAGRTACVACAEGAATVFCPLCDRTRGM